MLIALHRVVRLRLDRVRLSIAELTPDVVTLREHLLHRLLILLRVVLLLWVRHLWHGLQLSSSLEGLNLRLWHLVGRYGLDFLELAREREDRLALVLFKSMEDHVNEVAEGVEFLESMARFGISDHAGHSKIQTAEDHVLAMIVLDERYNLSAWLDGMDVFDVIVYGCVLVAFLRVVENFLKDSNVLEGQLPSRVALPLHVRQVQVFLHLLEHLWQEDDILRGVLEHLLAERPLRVPESLVILHLF